MPAPQVRFVSGHAFMRAAVLDRIWEGPPFFSRVTGRWSSTIPRNNPYKVGLIKLKMPDGKITRLVFGKAAQKPFGTVSKIDRHGIGVAIRNHIGSHGG